MIADEPDDSVNDISTHRVSQSVGSERRAISIPVKPVTTTVKMIEPLARRMMSRIAV
jgi:hypothetical protein